MPSSFELNYIRTFDEAEFGYVMNIDLEFDSHRKIKRFLRAPAAFLVQQMRDCEVRYERLAPNLKVIFDRAKHKEVSSFIKSEAVRKCLDKKEEDEAWESKRIMGCRWVLTWKSTPNEDLEEAAKDAASNPDTLFAPGGGRKAKARIVVLGYQHPDLLQPEFRSSAPVQATLTKHLTFQLTVQNQWDLEGLDLSTAFLQTEKNQESRRLWTTGVKELRQSLGVSEGGLLRILKDFYGSTTAPRGLWQDIDTKLQEIGGHKILGDPCAWIWLEDDPKLGEPRVVGYMAGHVDDFNRAGDNASAAWRTAKAKIDKLYRWGTIKKGEYRYVGSDIQEKVDAQGKYIEINQDFYIETIGDLAIDSFRFGQPELPMQPAEVAKCRASLGALQWVAVQTQPLICARCNLLLSDLARAPKMKVAQEIQYVINEVRKNPSRLTFRRLNSVQHWSQMVFVCMGDQSHNNRPEGYSTGGLVTLVGGPELSQGLPGRMNLISWRTWKLRRVAISSNDAEIQAMVEAEDSCFRSRLLWAELNGGGVNRGLDFLAHAVKCVQRIKGIVATDSKGGFDAITLQEGPMLGLSNVRAAIQAFQLKSFFRDNGAVLIWLASDWLLADALTKKKDECRKSLQQFLSKGVWMLQYNPGFETSARKSKKAGLDAASRIRDLTDFNVQNGSVTENVFVPMQQPSVSH